jgi:hypothetical protein
MWEPLPQRFRWVQCQLDQIRTMRTNKRILEALNNLPAGLFETYERILENIPRDDVWFVKKTISWIIVSDRPLRLVEIVEAMAIDTQTGHLDRDSTLNDEQDLLDICSSLVEYHEVSDTVNLSHYSVQVRVYV